MSWYPKLGAIILLFIGAFSAISGQTNNPCTKAGYVCLEDCKQLALCQKSNNLWSPVVITTCPDPLSCDAKIQGCTYQNGCSSATPQTKFNCQTDGLFPDPDNCNMYHVCAGANSDHARLCPAGTAYSALDHECIAGRGDCDKTKYICDTAWKQGVWLDDDNTKVIYVCLPSNAGFYPLLYMCQQGAVYDRQSYGCKDASGTTKSIFGDKCPTKEAIPVLNDCQKFQKCHNGVMTFQTCPAGSYYRKETQSCYIGNC